MLGKRNHCRIVGVREQGKGEGERVWKVEDRGEGEEGSHVMRCFFFQRNFVRA